MGALASRQSLIMLAFVNGVFITINDDDLIPELAPTLLYGQELSTKIIHGYPEHGRPKENSAWCEEKMKGISEFLNQGGLYYEPIELVTMAQMIIVDLMEEVTEPRKREVLGQLKEVIDKVSDNIDPGGTAFTIYETVDATLQHIYQQIGFIKEGRWLKQQRKLQRRARQWRQTGHLSQQKQ